MENKKSSTENWPSENSTVQNVELVTVIQVDSVIGTGTNKRPMRMLRQFFSKDGELLAQHDMKDDL
ncbi:hypothetical protein [Levilactobacillus spicheri]|uniref:Uncharacterized protein n=1 Tax=Levilactobacillus spicheri TaxID=216463 RepID=A0A0F3RTC0_9LACO|nr:hypothetical protein [Levilactobacillus spicheri]KJW12839.1 hypothetical protein VC81_06175 [Levilactobacillus spicheri]KJW13614.1 hypothetical protein VC81_03935 [Levilactobacillus spicheri]